jgi:excisionase family DNA binding protein
VFAVLTDGTALLASDGAGDDWLFGWVDPTSWSPTAPTRVPALRAGCEVVAWADLDAPALSLAAARGRRVLVVPLDERRPAAAYEVVERRPGPGLIRSADGAHRKPRSPIRQHPFRMPTLVRLSGGVASGPGAPGREGLHRAQSFSKARFLTVQEVADLMRVSSMTVYRLIKAGDLPAVRVGRSFRVSDSDVDAYLAARYTQAG